MEHMVMCRVGKMSVSWFVQAARVGPDPERRGNL
jgi:hypothetical protein